MTTYGTEHLPGFRVPESEIWSSCCVPDTWHFGVYRICGSMPLTNGSGCGSESYYFHHWASRCKQKSNKKKKFFCIFSMVPYFLKVLLPHNFSKIKSQKEGFPYQYYFCLMIEGSGSGSIHLTNGSWSMRPKNMWIRWIRIRIRYTETDTNRYSQNMDQDLVQIQFKFFFWFLIFKLWGLFFKVYNRNLNELA